MKGRVKRNEEAPLFVRETRWSEALRVFKCSHFNFVRGERAKEVKDSRRRLYLCWFRSPESPAYCSCSIYF